LPRKQNGVAVYQRVRHIRPLRTTGDVLMELTRLYRLGHNGRIALDEMARYAYVLKEIRAAIEAQQERTTIEHQPVAEVLVRVFPVASGSYLTAAEIADGRPAACAEVIELATVRADMVEPAREPATLDLVPERDPDPSPAA
jgi:hypothetical protein